MKILIVDDDLDVADTVKEALSNHDCTLAHDGRKASELLGVEDFDLVITDINMPSGGGERILMELKPKNDTPIFVYTGEQDNLDTYTKLGANAIFLKPGGIESLIDAVAELGSKQSR